MDTDAMFLFFNSRAGSNDLVSLLTWVSWGADQYSAGRGSGITAIFQPSSLELHHSALLKSGRNTDVPGCGFITPPPPPSPTFQSQCGSSGPDGDAEPPHLSIQLCLIKVAF